MNDSKTLAIYGASGHGKVTKEIAELNGYEKFIFIDDGKNDHYSFEEYLQTDYDYPMIIAIGNNKIREQAFNKIMKHKIKLVTLIHPSAIISPSVKIEEGTVVMPRVVINCDTTIGKCVILNTACVIEHDDIIKDFVHISPNAALSGNVTVRRMTQVGIGTSVIQGITIGENSMVGAGSVVVKNLPSNSLSFGVPAKKVRVYD